MTLPPLLLLIYLVLAGRSASSRRYSRSRISAYEPSGQGDLLYLWIEKRGMGAEYFTRQIARRLDIPVGEIGTAGLKDRRAVTRQMVSLPASVEPRLPQLDGDGIRVLRVSRHGNKLRPGHLHGNRFRILIRAATVRERGESSLPDGRGSVVDEILERIRQHGLPNFYGPQRFGHDGETLQLGPSSWRGEKTAKPRQSLPEKAGVVGGNNRPCSISPKPLRVTVCCAALLRDVMCSSVWRHTCRRRRRSGIARFERARSSRVRPIFGRKTFAAKDEAAQGEQVHTRGIRLTASSRRVPASYCRERGGNNLVYVADLAAWRRREAGLRLSLSLPAGSYATVFRRDHRKRCGP